MQEAAARQGVLAKHAIPNGTWIESGTYRGETTEFLSRTARQVYSIEPGPELFVRAHCHFKHHANVKIIQGLSEDVFPQLLPTLSGDVCFWLDGHYSGEDTHKGPQDTPIVAELTWIAANMFRWGKVAILIDDVHLFNGKQHIYGPYPRIAEVMDWAKKQNLRYHIESDIFVATNVRVMG